jgi:hypothetical protein
MVFTHPLPIHRSSALALAAIARRVTRRNQQFGEARSDFVDLTDFEFLDVDDAIEKLVGMKRQNSNSHGLVRCIGGGQYLGQWCVLIGYEGWFDALCKRMWEQYPYQLVNCRAFSVKQGINVASMRLIVITNSWLVRR